MTAPAAVSSDTPPYFKIGAVVICPTLKRKSTGLVKGHGLDERFVKVLKRTRSHWLRAETLRLAD